MLLFVLNPKVLYVVITLAIWAVLFLIQTIALIILKRRLTHESKEHSFWFDKWADANSEVRERERKIILLAQELREKQSAAEFYKTSLNEHVERHLQERNRLSSLVCEAQNRGNFYLAKYEEAEMNLAAVMALANSYQAKYDEAAEKLDDIHDVLEPAEASA